MLTPVQQIVIGLFHNWAALVTLLPNNVGPVTVNAPTEVVDPIAPFMLMAALPVVPAFNVNAWAPSIVELIVIGLTVVASVVAPVRDTAAL